MHSLAAIYSYEGSSHVGELLQMWVDTGARGSSLASDLFRELSESAASGGYTEIVAEVYSGNARAISFYKKLGFESNLIGKEGLNGSLQLRKIL